MNPSTARNRNWKLAHPDRQALFARIPAALKSTTQSEAQALDVDSVRYIEAALLLAHSDRGKIQRILLRMPRSPRRNGQGNRGPTVTAEPSQATVQGELAREPNRT